MFVRSTRMARENPETDVMTQMLPEPDIATQLLPEEETMMTQPLLSSPSPVSSKGAKIRMQTETASPRLRSQPSTKTTSTRNTKSKPQSHRIKAAAGTRQGRTQPPMETTHLPTSRTRSSDRSKLTVQPSTAATLSNVTSSTSASAVSHTRFSEFPVLAGGEVSSLPFDVQVKLSTTTGRSAAPKKSLTVKAKPIKSTTKSPRPSGLLKKKSPLKRLQSATVRAAKPVAATRVKREPGTVGRQKIVQRSVESPDQEVGRSPEPAESVDKKPLDGDVINVDQEEEGTSKMADGLWDIYEIVSNRVGANYTSVKRVVQMLEQGATLPFICRYRREQSGGLSTDSIQSIQEEHKRLLQVRKKAEALSVKLQQQGQLSEPVREAIFQAKTCDELDLVAEPFKSSGPRTHAAKARSIGLEPVALSFWRGEKSFNELRVAELVDRDVEGKRNEEQVLQSIQYILADELRKDRVALDAMDSMSRSPQLALIVKKKKKVSSKAPTNPKESEEKFRDYFEFQRSITSIDSHQILAINRGENLGFLSVTVHLSDFVINSLKDVLRRKFHQYALDPAARLLIENTVSDCVERLCKPYLTRIVRAHLRERAENEAIKVFASNLRSLLMAPPVRGQAVLGIDPGFANGCKMAMISRSGEVLAHDVMFPDRQRHKAKRQLSDLIRTHSCSLIAVGDGKGSQQVKALITECNREGVFGGQRVRFTTVREAGVSVYSVTADAEKELPGLDSFVKSAVAIARRLQDPLVEYVKVEPRHLGVGMYQHDINEARLKESLQGTVVECVSFVGVDLNVCPEFLLRQVAGLNATAARNVIEHRQKYGPFMNREQLQLVPHIGPTRYEQCAGFVKIFPETVQRCLDDAVIVTRVKKPNMKQTISEEFDPLDTTIIHPESYSIARSLISELGLRVTDVGSAEFIKVISDKTTTAAATVNRLMTKLNASQHTIEFILKALAARHDSDVRDEGSAPIFSESLQDIKDLRPGDSVRGKVMNVVPFGAFVDIALGNDVLLPKQFMGSATGKLRVGDAIEGRVMSVEAARNRVSIHFVKYL